MMLTFDDRGLTRFVSQLESFYAAYPGLLEKIHLALSRLSPQELAESCRQLRVQGVFPELELRTDQQVGALWASDVYQAVLREVGFYPPADLDLRTELEAPCQDWDELALRASRPPALEHEPYWRWALRRSYSELYLEPALERMTPPLRGCDLACGWGKASFSLRRFEGRQIHCCDLSEPSLELLERLAEKAELSAHLHPVRCDLTRLPFEDSSVDFFLIFDIFEQLTGPTIDRMLAEVLRCAKPGGAVYCKIAVHAHCPAATHIQDFSPQALLARFQSSRNCGRTFRKLHFDARVPDQYSFRIVEPGGKPKAKFKPRTR